MEYSRICKNRLSMQANYYLLWTDAVCTIANGWLSGDRVGFIREKTLGCVVAVCMMGNCSANYCHRTGLKIALLYVSAIVPSLCKRQNTSVHSCTKTARLNRTKSQIVFCELVSYFSFMMPHRWMHFLNKLL